MTKALSPLAASLKDAVATLKTQKAVVAALRIKVQAERENAKAAKVQAKEAKALDKFEKQAVAIAKAQARLDKLLSKQVGAVGSKATKANRKPGKVTTYGAEDNAIASAIMARKASA